jgi:hypothetical protein
LFQEAGYTALSRGRLSNHLFAVAPYNPRAEIAHGEEDVAHRDALAGLVDSLSHSHEQVMALETLPTSTFADDAPPPSQWLDAPAAHSSERYHSDWGRYLAHREERDNEPPAPSSEHEWAWSRDDDTYDHGYDDGFGL